MGEKVVMGANYHTGVRMFHVKHRAHAVSFFIINGMTQASEGTTRVLSTTRMVSI